MARTKKHPGSLTQRSPGVWRLRLCVSGARHSFTVQGTKVDAQNYATEKHDELSRDATRKTEGRPGPVRFSALMAAFKENELPSLSAGTSRSYNDSFKVFRKYFVEMLGDPRADKVRRGDIKAFLAWRRTYRVGKKGGVSAHTVSRDLRVLRRLFNHALDVEQVDLNPCARVKAPKPDRRDPPILTDDQYEALLSAAGHPMLKLYILLLGDTGARAYSEALKLEWTDIDLQGGFIHIKSGMGRRTKSGKSRWVPMTPRLRQALQDHAAEYRLASPSAHVFHHLTTTRRAKKGERIKTMRAAFDRAGQKAKLPDGFRAHDLRHRRVTTWLAGGANPVHVKEALGHADLATTMGYTHLLPEHLRALVDGHPPHRSASEKTG
jgi:integrase/recombinase XerD